MSDLLTQFDIVDRAEQARHRSGGSDDAILGGGGGGVRDSLNPFDDQELQSPVAAMQVSSSFCKVGLGAVAVVKELATGDVSKKPIIFSSRSKLPPTISAHASRPRIAWFLSPRDPGSSRFS